MHLRPPAFVTVCASLLTASALLAATPERPQSHLPPELRLHLVCAYDFEHPAPADSALELDQGASGTPLQLVNGGAAMRVPDGAYPQSLYSLQTRQIDPVLAGQDDWKAGVFEPAGVPALARFAGASGLTLSGWVKATGPTLQPAPNTTTPAPRDRFPSICLFGILHGQSDGHPARALIELIQVEGKLRLIALGRRLDGGAGLVLAATAEPAELLPPDTWVHLAATFDYSSGEMVFYRNGESIAATLVTPGDPWQLAGGERASTRASDTPPAGLKIGGSYPQNTRERNPFDGRFDDLCFFDRVLTAGELGTVFASRSAGPEAPDPAQPKPR